MLQNEPQRGVTEQTFSFYKKVKGQSGIVNNSSLVFVPVHLIFQLKKLKMRALYFPTNFLSVNEKFLKRGVGRTFFQKVFPQ